jgi:membrane protease YdiL (CAAX protease family)
MAMLALLAIFVGVMGGSIAAWSGWIARLRSRSSANQTVAEPQATVGLIDILVAVVALFVLFFITALVWRLVNLGSAATTPNLQLSSEPVASPVPTSASIEKRMSERDYVYSTVMSSAQIVWVFVMTAFIAMRSGCSLKKLGWRSDQIGSDLRAGVQCFLLVTPPLLLLSTVLQFGTKVEYEHPIIDMVKKYPWLLGIAFWQAAIVAPISEEFAFRVLLIGWFESIYFAANKPFAFLFGQRVQSTTPSTQSTQETQHLTSPIGPGINAPQAQAELPVQQTQPYAPPSHSVLETETYAPAENNQCVLLSPVRPPWWPAILSGCLFGLAHFSYGISWVPLIVFGVVLGRLYQWRQSILPVMLVHFLFNGTNIVMLGLGLLLPNSNPK